MFSKKTRNLTVAVLALVMALTLTFGLFGFNTTQVNAATVTEDTSEAGYLTQTYTEFTDAYEHWDVKEQTGVTKAIGSSRIRLDFDQNLSFTDVSIFSKSEYTNVTKVSFKLKTNSDKVNAKYTLKIGNATVKSDVSIPNKTEKTFTDEVNNVNGLNGAISILFSNTASTTSSKARKIEIYSISVTTKTEKPTVEKLTLPADAPTTMYVGDSAYTFPTTLSATLNNGSTQDLTVAWKQGETAVTSFEPTAVDTYKFTASVTDASVKETTLTATLTITVKPAITKTINKVLPITKEVVLGTELSSIGLPEFVNVEWSGTEADGSLTKDTDNLKVTWDTTGLDLTTAGIKTINGKFDKGTYQLANGITETATLTLKVRPMYGSTLNLSAKWNIKDDRLGKDVDWNTIFTDKVLANNDGITISAGSEVEKPDNKGSSIDNCIKAKNNKQFLQVTVPANFSGDINILAAAYASGQEITLDLFKTASIEGYEADKSNTKQVITGTTVTDGSNTLTDDNFIYKNSKPASFKVNNDTAESATYYIYLVNNSKSGFACSIEVTGTTPGNAAKNYFYAGEKLGTMNVNGYTFLGWTNADGTKLYKDTATEEATADVAGDYYALLAKAEYMGVGFRLDKVGVRYGFGINFYDLNDAETATNSLKSTTVNKILETALTQVTFNATINNTEYPYSYTKEKLKYTYDEETNKFVSNLVFVNFSNQTTQFGSTVKVDATFTINGVVLSANGTASKISDKLTEANNDKFSIPADSKFTYEQVAAMYGLTA